MSAILCPKCRAAIPPDDVNVKEGVAFCRACNTLTRLADLADQAEITAADPASPPQGCDFSSNGNETTITVSARSAGAAIGALFFSLFWNGIVSVFVLVAIAGSLQHIFGSVPAWFPAPSMGKAGQTIPVGMLLFLWVFLMPFILIGILMLCVFFVSVAGRIEVQIRPDLASVFIGCGPLGWTRRFDPATVKSVTIGQTTWQQNNRSKPVVVIDCGRQIRFGSMLPDDRRNWLGAILKSLIVVKA